MGRRGGEPRHPHGDLLGPGRRAAAAGNNGDLATPQPAVSRAESFPPALGDLQRHVRAVPPPVGHQNAAPLPGPGNKPAGDGGGNLPRHGNDDNIHPIDERGDHGGPLGAGIGHKRKPIQSDATLRGGERAERGDADDGTPGTGAARRPRAAPAAGRCFRSRSAACPGQRRNPRSPADGALRRDEGLPTAGSEIPLAERIDPQPQRAAPGRQSAVGRAPLYRRAVHSATHRPAVLSPPSAARSTGKRATA